MMYAFTGIKLAARTMAGAQIAVAAAAPPTKKARLVKGRDFIVDHVAVCWLAAEGTFPSRAERNNKADQSPRR
jgi:hypothetical protein